RGVRGGRVAGGSVGARRDLEAGRHMMTMEIDDGWSAGVAHWRSPNAAAGSWTWWRRDTRQKPWARQTGDEQCLGHMPWKKPGDCNRARRFFVKEDRTQVNAGARASSTSAAAERGERSCTVDAPPRDAMRLPRDCRRIHLSKAASAWNVLLASAVCNRLRAARFRLCSHGSQLNWRQS